MVVDIDATKEKRGPNFTLIKNLATECRMPLCYGGGVTTVEEAKKIITLGAEKVALSSAAINNPELLKKIGEAVGVQSVVVVLDIKKRKLFGGYDIYTHNGTKKVKLKLDDFLQTIEQIGIGELVINSIDCDGKMGGYDLDLAEHVRKNTSIPLTILGEQANCRI